MQREIEFRGKDVTGKWRYGNLVKTKLNYSIAVPRTNFGVKAFIIEDTSTIGQYTGFKDKNGKKIFEGDIVKFKYFTEIDYEEGKGIVKFGDGAFKICSDIIYNFIYVNDYEVIGTIFDEENKE